MTKKPGRASRLPSADEIVSSHPARDAINRARQIIRDAVPTAVESVKWNAPSFATSDHFATFFLGGKRKGSGFQLILHLGAKPRHDSSPQPTIADPDRLLEWRAPDRALITFQDEDDVAAKEASVRAIVQEWASSIPRA